LRGVSDYHHTYSRMGVLDHGYTREDLYGHPGAARAWTKERDSQLLKHFNTDGWTAIFTKLNQIWSVKPTDDEYMLGIRRQITFPRESGNLKV
jgi:hypothetical protein